jgi:hypothetical protein
MKSELEVIEILAMIYSRIERDKSTDELDLYRRWYLNCVDDISKLLKKEIDRNKFNS